MATKVVLAYPYSDDKGDHKPDTTLTVEDAQAEVMIREGLARHVDNDNEDVRAPKKSATVDATKKD